MITFTTMSAIPVHKSSQPVTQQQPSAIRYVETRCPTELQTESHNGKERWFKWLGMCHVCLTSWPEKLVWETTETLRFSVSTNYWLVSTNRESFKHHSLPDHVNSFVTIVYTCVWLQGDCLETTVSSRKPYKALWRMFPEPCWIYVMKKLRRYLKLKGTAHY